MSRWGTRNIKQIRWARHYRARMDAGQEHCRRCHTTSELTFGHIIPRAVGGTFTLSNVTILCAPCNRLLGAAVSHFPALVKPKYPQAGRSRRRKRDDGR